MTLPDQSHESGAARAAGRIQSEAERQPFRPTGTIYVDQEVARSVGFDHYHDPIHGTYVPKAPRTNPC